MRPRQIKLEEIRIDGGTQPRVRIDQNAVTDYAEAMSGGEAFPAVDLVHDGATYWLVDGFHRYHAARRAGKVSISAFVKAGQQADAVWASLAVNKTHGLRRTNADKAKAVTTALQHPNSEGLSNRLMAEHCGVSEGFIRKLRCSATAHCAQSISVRTGRDGRTIDTSNIGKTKTYHDDGPVEPSSGKATNSGDAGLDDIPLDVPTRPASSGSSASSASSVSSVTDQVGNVVTGLSPGIAEAFDRRDEITHLMSAVSNLKTTVTKAADQGDLLFAELNISRFEADCGNIHRALRAIRPHAVCPYCSGDGCRACLKRGWLGQFTYEAAPKELKQ